MSYFLKKGLLLKWLLLIIIASLSACSGKTDNTTPRRSPSDNPNSPSIGQAAGYQSKKNEIKKSNGDFDTYQNYQSADAPVSLKEIKKNRRRPVLNVQELNGLMDKNFKKLANFASEGNPAEKANCTEDKCELKKVINYNKAIAKKNKPDKGKISAVSGIKLDEPNKNSLTIQEHKAIIASKKDDTVKSIPENNVLNKKPITTKNENSYNNPALAPLPSSKNSSLMAADKNVGDSSNSSRSLKEDQKTSSGDKKNTSESKTSSGKNTSGLDKAEMLKTIKNSQPVFSNDFLGDREIQAKPMPPVTNKIIVPVDLERKAVNQEKPALNQPSLPQTNKGNPLPPQVSGYNQQTLVAPLGVSGQPPLKNTNTEEIPAPQFNKKPNTGEKLSLVNKILINYYYKIKSKIFSLFTDE